MKYYPKVVGERIYLSPINMEDIEQYTKWINDSGISDNLGNSSQLYTPEKEKEALEGMVKTGYNFAIIRFEDNQLLGNISFFDINQINRSAQCGLFIGEKENRNKGYGQEALKLLLSYGFDTLNLNNVMLKVFAFNKAAIACYKQVGFKIIGERRNAYFIGGEYHNEIFMDILTGDL